MVIATPAGHIALGCPRAGARSNGETTLCAMLGLSSPDARMAAHNVDAGRPRDAPLEERATQAAREAGLVPDGAHLQVVTAEEIFPTKKEMLFELSHALAERGFAANVSGSIVYLLADKAHGHVECQPRLLGNDPHGMESADPGRWGAFARIGVGAFAGSSSKQQEWLERLHAVRSKHGKLDSAVHGQRAGPGGFAARQGKLGAALDSKKHGKRAGPGGFAARHGALDSAVLGKRAGPGGFAAADSAVLGKRAGPGGFAAQHGALDSAVLGKRAGPDGFMARKKSPVVATAKAVCTEGAPPHSQIIKFTQWGRGPHGRLGTWHAPTSSKLGRVTITIKNFNAIPPVITRTVKGRKLCFTITEYGAIPPPASPVGEN